MKRLNGYVSSVSLLWNHGECMVKVGLSTICVAVRFEFGISRLEEFLDILDLDDECEFPMENMHNITVVVWFDDNSNAVAISNILHEDEETSKKFFFKEKQHG